MHRLARVTERRDHLDEEPRGDRRRAFDPRRIVTVVEDEGTGGAWVHLALRDEWEGPADATERHDGCRVLLTRESYDEVLREIDFAMRGFPSGSNPSLLAPVSYLELSTRVRNSLTNLGIVTIEQLCGTSPTELLKAPRFGYSCLEEVRKRLAARGLALRGET